MKLWWQMERGSCVMCRRPLGKRKVSHFIQPPPFCLDDTKECKRLLAERLGVPE